MRIVCFTIALFIAVSGNAQVFTMLKDIAPGATSGNSTNDYFCVYNGKIYFRGNDNATVNNWELWSTDGTSAGTTLVKEIDPTVGSNPNYMTVINGKMLFAAGDPVNSYEFFSSDGTAAGTAMLKDINPGSTSGFANASFPSYFSVYNGELYFTAKEASTGFELWKSDGSAAGTVMVKDINPGVASGAYSSINTMKSMNGFLYFPAFDGVTGVELWKTDGTAAGTTLVKDINPSLADSNPFNLFAVINNELYFIAVTAANGAELWKTDGTNAGTVMIKDINPGTTGALATVSAAVQLNGFLYFSANDGVNGRELWKSDGTAAGTVMIKDINPGAANSAIAVPAVLNNRVYFAADDGVNGTELWKTDGTAAGTVLVKDINPGSAASVPGNFTNIGGIIVFNAYTTTNGTEPWRTDGTSANTEMIEDVAAGTASSAPGKFLEYNGKVYTTMTTPAFGYELWVGSLPVVIPLRLLEFKGAIVHDYAQLNWKTAEEVNTRNFIIERSLDGISFTGIGAVNAANEAGTQQYYYTDQSASALSAKKIFYRLKQQDIDGKFTYSPVIAISFPVSNFSAALYPNPAKETVYVQVNTTKKQTVKLKLFDMNGKLLKQHAQMLNEGSNYIPVQAVSFAAGLYRIYVQSVEKQQVLSLVKE